MKKIIVYCAILLVSCNPSKTDNSTLEAPVDTIVNSQVEPDNSTPAGDKANTNSENKQENGETKKESAGNTPGVDDPSQKPGENKTPDKTYENPGNKNNLDDTAMESNGGKIKHTGVNGVKNTEIKYTDQKDKLNDTAQEIKKRVVKKY